MKHTLPDYSLATLLVITLTGIGAVNIIGTIAILMDTKPAIGCTVNASTSDSHETYRYVERGKVWT